MFEYAPCKNINGIDIERFILEKIEKWRVGPINQEVYIQ